MIVYLESQDNGPYETKTESRIAVDDVVGAHVLQVHALLAQELQRFVHVLQAMDTHLAFRWTGLYIQKQPSLSKPFIRTQVVVYKSNFSLLYYAVQTGLNGDLIKFLLSVQ